MGLKMMVTFLFLLVGLAYADPGEITPDFEMIGYNTNIDDPKYRLLDNVQPTYFHVDLDVYLSESRFNGIVQVDVQIRQNLTQIVMHQNVVAITGVNVVDANNQPVNLQFPNSFETDSYYEILKINFASTIIPGQYTITISYLGRINENPHDRGFYKGYYYDGNEKREYATTQFQPYHARKAFPCFDEPQFKCPFVISITRDANLSPSYSNMAINATQQVSTGRVRETFLPTPAVSSYLIAFHVSDFVATNESSRPNRPFQIVSRRGPLDQHSYAAEIGMKITEVMDEYFDIDYYDMGQGQPMKNDHIALPDFPSGAMENWGMVNYREAYLLYHQNHTNVLDKIFIATIIAHELAHKWFGNLVTCFWWSNLWLNESFASYFEYFGAHYADTSLELDDRFILNRVQSALSADASAGATPMNWTEVASNPSVTAHFSTTSYAKGASVLRTLEHFVGYETFQKALRYYLKDNAYGIGYPIDMYNAFRRACSEDPTFQTTYPNIDIGVVFDNWVQNPGSPVLNVDVNMSTGQITITQERFQLSGTVPDTIWHIPITWTHGGSPNFNDLKPKFVFTNKTMTIRNEAGHHWVVFNLQHSGLYRVNYDDHSWEMLASQLRRNRTVIHKLNRAQMTNDVMFFLRAGKISVRRAFDVLSFLKDESDYYVWNGVLSQLDWVRRRLEHLPRAHEEFNTYLLELLEGAIQELGFEERANEAISTTQSRMQIMNYACQLGHEGCISDSLEKWRQFRNSNNYLVPKNARRYVYCTGLRYGNASDYQFLFQKYNTSENTADMVVMLRTLACTRDNASLSHYLVESMQNDKIRVHDKTNAFSFALLGNQQNVPIVLDFLYRNYAEMRQSYGGQARLDVCVSALATHLTNFEHIVAFQAWLYREQVALGTSFNSGVNVINSALNNIRWGNNVAPDLFTTIRNRNASATISVSIVLLAVALVAHVFQMSWFFLSLAFLVLNTTNADNPLWIEEIEELPEFSAQSVSRSADKVYRLPENVVPLEYDIFIDLYFAERTDRPFSFDGREFIVIQATEENVTNIVLHSNVDSINSITLLSDNGETVNLNLIEPYTLEPQYHFLRINLQQAMDLGRNYTLYIDYSNSMNDGPMKRGIWKGWYTDDEGVERIYAATHFQPYNARQAFPCWDEPLFKAVFKLHLSKPSSYIGTYSNTGIENTDTSNSFVTFSLENNRTRDNFLESPKMSSYLVTFLVSESFKVIASNTSFTPAIRIVGRSNTAGLGDHALDLTVKMTEYFDDYFKIPYSSLHPNLLNDHISSPDWASAGTENWGMVSYRELYLIIDPRETIMSVEHYATTLVSHELAHKWFGNLITCFWWSNTWINEGFASYFGYIAAHQMFPQYDLHEHFNSRYLQTSLNFDSGVTTVPLNHDVNSPAQVTGHFGTISYSKGAAFLRMLGDMITPGTFQKACQYFLLNNPYEATDQYDLYDAFAKAIDEDRTLNEYSNFNFTDFYRIWVNEAGYPLLTVEVNYITGEMALTQERFFLSASAGTTDQIYPIPITYSSKAKPDFTNLTATYMLTSKQAIIQKEAADEWVIFNNQQHGHYRVNYDVKTWNLISEALLNDPESIHYLNRAQIVNDVFALMRANKLTYRFGFHIIKFLRNEINYHVWNPAISGYTWLRNRLRHLPESQATFDSYLLSYMDYVINTLGYEPASNESVTITLTRQEVLHFACTLGHEICIQNSRDKFISMRDQGAWVDPRIRRHVYIAGVRQGGQQDFEFLLNRYRNSNFANDQLEILRALGATRDPQLLTRYLEFTLDKAVRSHDKATSFNYALLGNPENAHTVLQFVKNNINAIRVAYVEEAPPNPVHTALSNLAAYLDEAGLVEYQEWLRSTQTNTAQFNSAISAISSARNNMAWGTANVDMILNAARDSATNVMMSTLLISIMAVIAVFL
nr:uncharacterized protein LOC113392185 [Vanessa tameamea]